MQKSTAAVIIALIVGATSIVMALVVKWYLIQKVVYDNGYSQVMQPMNTYSTAIWVKKGAQ